MAGKSEPCQVSTKMRYKNLIALGALVAGLLVIGCGGSGGSTPSTVNTNTGSNTGSNNNGGSGGNNPDFTVTETPSTGNVTVAAPNVTFAVKLNFTDPSAKIEFTTMNIYQEGSTSVLSAPGMYGAMQTPAGTSIDGLEQTSLTAVYAANPANIVFGGWDDVQVTVWSSKLPNGQKSQMLSTQTGTDWKTLPQAINATCGTISLNETTVKPGGVIEAKIGITPGFDCSSYSFNVGGFTPAKVTANGNPVSLPATAKFADTAGPFEVTFDITVPASQTAMFPVSSSQAGDTGSWIFLSGSGSNGPWAAADPFFIHS
jgi:hypothetical protein